MRKTAKVLLIVLITVLLASCDLLFKKSDNSSAKPDISDSNLNISDFSTSYGKALFIQYNYNKEVINTLKDNGAEIPSLSVSEITFCDPSVYYKNQSDKIDTVKFDEALTVLNDDFDREIRKIADSLSIPRNMKKQDGYLYTADDVCMDLYCPEAIGTIEATLLIESGKEPDEAIEVLNHDVRYLIPQKKGLSSKNDVLKWTDGKIPYVINVFNFTPEQRDCIRNALKEWNIATNGTVEFIEVPANTLTKIKTEKIPYLQIYRNDNIDAAAQSQLGMNDENYIEININGIASNSEHYKCSFTESLRRSTMHEAGHVLGLYHEHQRPDRDLYLSCSSNNNDNIIPYNIKFKNGYFVVNDLIFDEDFNFDSIMLYGDIDIKEKYQTITGKTKTAFNLEISQQDADFIKQMYTEKESDNDTLTYRIATNKETQGERTELNIELISREINSDPSFLGASTGSFKPSKDTIDFDFKIFAYNTENNKFSTVYSSTKEIETIFTYPKNSFSVDGGFNEVNPVNGQITNKQNLKTNGSLKIKGLNTGTGVLFVNLKEKGNPTILDTITYTILVRKYYIVTLLDKDYVYDDFSSPGIRVLLSNFNQERKVCTGFKVIKGLCDIKEKDNFYYIIPKSDCTVMPIFEDLLPNETVFDWYERNNIPYIFSAPITTCID